MSACEFEYKHLLSGERKVAEVKESRKDKTYYFESRLN